MVLALDTATPAITAGVVAVEVTRATVAERVTVDARAHGELLTPNIADVLARAGVSAAALDAIVCGNGPGPFTGLRVGMVTAAALGHALNVPVFPVMSLDAIAATVPVGTPFLVVTDARRREVYWAAYDGDGRRLAGPAVDRPEVLATRVAEFGACRAAGHGADSYADVLGLPAVRPWYPSPDGLVAVAAPALAAGAAPAPLTPQYLRRPDAAPPGPGKRVSR